MLLPDVRWDHRSKVDYKTGHSVVRQARVVHRQGCYCQGLSGVSRVPSLTLDHDRRFDTRLRSATTHGNLDQLGTYSNDPPSHTFRTMEVSTPRATASPAPDPPDTGGPLARHPPERENGATRVPRRAPPVGHHELVSDAVFPSEIFTAILGFSDGPTIRRCKQVCHMLRNLVESNQCLQYILELDICGYVVPPIPRLDLTYAEKVQMLREHRKWWQQTELADPTFFPFLPELEPHMTDFVDGTFACGYTATTDPHESIRVIHFDRLPSSNKGTGHERWQHDHLVFGVKDFMIQPEQDLLILLEEKVDAEYTADMWDDPVAGIFYHIHLRTMSENKPHPAAMAGTVLSLDPGERVDLSVYGASYPQVNGRLFGVIFKRETGLGSVFVLVIDWILGMEVANIEIPGRNSHNVLGILSDKCFIVARNPDDKPMPDSYDNLGCLDVYRVPQQSHEAGVREVDRIASFMLPDLAVEQTTLKLELHCGYAPMSTSSLKSTQHLPKIFESAPGNHLLSVNIGVTKYESAGLNIHPARSASGALCVSSQTLLDIAQQKLDDDRPNDPSNLVQIPWEAWGHRASWLKPCEFSLSRPHYTWGLRGSSFRIQRFWKPLPDEGFGLSFVDFEPIRVRARRAEGREFRGQVCSSQVNNSGEANAYDHTNVLERTFFGGDTVPAQQYKVASMRVEGGEKLGRFFTAMVDDEHIVIKVNHDPVNDHVKPGIYVYTL